MKFTVKRSVLGAQDPQQPKSCPKQGKTLTRPQLAPLNDGLKLDKMAINHGKAPKRQILSAHTPQFRVEDWRLRLRLLVLTALSSRMQGQLSWPCSFLRCPNPIDNSTSQRALRSNKFNPDRIFQPGLNFSIPIELFKCDLKFQSRSSISGAPLVYRK